MKIYGIPVATPIDPVVVKKDIPGHLEVTVDENNVASHSAQEIDAHVAKGGSVVLNFTDSSASHGYACLWARTSALVIFLETYVSEGGVTQTFFFIDGDKNCTEEVVTFEVSGGTVKSVNGVEPDENGNVVIELPGGVTEEDVSAAVEAYMAENPVETGATEEQAAQIQANTEAIEAIQNGGKTFADIEVTENADGSVTMKNTFTDGSSETIVMAAGEKPDSVTYNGVAIPITWVTATDDGEGTEVSE